MLLMIRSHSHVFEGAQGVLLDEKYGFFPHVTKSNTTFENAIAILEESEFDGDIKKVGVIRAYYTRHGQGPFPSERRSLYLPDLHNGTGRWQGEFRVGVFDEVLARYALRVVKGVDMLIMTCVDRLFGMGEMDIVESYQGEMDASKYRGSNQIRSLVVNSRMSPSEHVERNAMINSCHPLSSGLVDGMRDINDKNGIGDFILGMESVMGMRIDFISVGPTCEGKIDRKDYKEYSDE